MPTTPSHTQRLNASSATENTTLGKVLCRLGNAVVDSNKISGRDQITPEQFADILNQTALRVSAKLGTIRQTEEFSEHKYTLGSDQLTDMVIENTRSVNRALSEALDGIAIAR